jgi:hypothetical protein
MKNTNKDPRAPWVSRILFAAALAAGCGSQASSPSPIEVEDNSEALSAAEIECESTKRECLIAADCEPEAREVCEEAFRACEEPARAEKKRVREACKVERETCEEAAADDEAAKHACHIAEHRCKLPVEPPDAVCRVDAEECRWAARSEGGDGTTPTPDNAAEEACRETERECKDALRVDREELPKPPHCGPNPPACEPAEPGTEEAPAPLPISPDECEQTKVACLVAADCEPDARELCETAFRACREPLDAEKKRVHDECRTVREACDDAAADEAGRRACHLAEHECKLPVEPPEAVCRIAAHECVWAAQDASTEDGPSAAEEACRETERACVEEKRVPREDMPKPPHCGPKPPACAPGAPAPAPGAPAPAAPTPAVP